MKRYIIILTTLVLGACSETEKIQHIDFVTPVESALIVKSDVIRYHQVPAVILAKKRADLAFQLSGTVDNIFVNIGETVDEQQALMRVYNPNLDPAINSNLAKQESLKIQIVQAERDFDKLQELRKKNSASKNELEQKETNLKDLQSQLKLVQSQIDLALANQSESVIKAPFNGSVVSSLKQQGEFVQAGQVVMTLFNQDELEVEVNITQVLWKNLKLGDQITGTYSNQSINFEVVELAQTAETQSHLMKVILELEKPFENSIGQQVVINFPQNYQNIYRLPLETIVDDGINKPYLFTVVNDKSHKNFINPLYIEKGHIVFNTEIEIEGPVIFKGQSKLSEGMKVKVL